ncbi:MAG: ABC transporter permease [Pseudomonadota bacterium]
MRALWSYWRRNPVQLLAVLGGLALATALWSGVQAINAEARASYDSAAATLGEGQYDQLLAREGGAVSLDTYLALRRAGWLVSPVVEGRLGEVRLLGVDPLTAPGGLAPAGLAPTDTRDRLFAAPETAADLPPDLPVSLDPNAAPGVALGDIGRVMAILDRSDFSRLLIAPEQPLNRLPLAEIAPGLRLEPSNQTADVAALTDSFHLNLTAFGLLSFAVGIFIVQSAIGLAFEQRRPMVRTLRAQGVPMGRLVALMGAEVAMLGLLGGAAGVILGYAIAAALLPDVAATLRGLYGADVAGTIAIRAEWWMSGIALALAGTALAAGARLWAIARMPVLASARPRAWAMGTARARRWQGAAAVLLWVMAGALAIWGSGLLAGFAMLGGLLLGAALLLPGIVDAALRPLARRAGAGAGTGAGPLPGWFWADTRQQVPGLSLALMALLLAMAANVGVSTMVSSFRVTFVAFLDQRLSSDLYVRFDTVDAAERARPALAAAAQEVMPLLSVERTVAARPAEVFGVAVGPTYRENWVFLDAAPDPWDAVAQGKGALVNEQLARRAGLWVGDSVTVDATRLPIVGVVGDYGNPVGQVVLGQELFVRLFPGVGAQRFGLRTEAPDVLRAVLTGEIGLSPAAITDQAALKAFSLRVFERTFTVTAALNVLTLGVAGIAMLMSLLTLADLRVPQVAPIWAMGLTRRRLGGLELLRALALAALVGLAALPLGLALAWVLLTVINVEAFGWQLPMYLFPADYARLGVYALGAAALAAAWPALRLMRVPPARLLQVFSHGR